MSAIKLRDNIYAVGAVDPEVRIFHGYETPFGATYNCYLVIDEKITLIDNVKALFTEQFIQNIEEIVPLEKIDVLIQNHIEPDHSGSFPEILKRNPNLEVYLTSGSKNGIKAYYGLEDYNAHVVKLGDTLSTGKYTYHFVPAPMVHWPDSMLTYLAEEKILFSNDAFGQHVCTGETYDDEMGLERLMERAMDYYGNIVLPFGNQVQKVLEQAAGLDIGMICPSHGVILRSYIKEIVEAYGRWARNECDMDKVVIVYDSMWGSTEEMAYKIKKEYEDLGKKVHMHCLRDEHYSQVMGDVVEAKFVFLGASTLNNNMMPTMAAFVTYMKGLRPKDRIGLAFGSYGWSGEATKQVDEIMQGLGWHTMPIRKQLYRG
ncbi:FprA family A-type flavoprotein [Intestinibacillus sp. Marseille-P6563]|uniref:FprA family A-type flavoprotein n=1 Tax=Intestinibacillus sp. Marseille-P6563 TaxID=2364792 RepID=UPI000F0456D6|nr:FprA family A-type flavoprotein [Intestinibacillus sp. Marseille-P6563]